MRKEVARSAQGVVLAAAVLWAPVMAQAQPGSPTPAPAESAAQTSYPPEYFTPFNPVTAEDIVRRVPGFTLDNGLDRRGFAASAGNVLIDGERPSSKTPISEQLSRISARDVARVDVHSGADNSDARGHTLVVDVRLKLRQSGATNTFVVQAGVLEPGITVNPLVVVTSAFRLAGADASLAVQALPARRGRIEYDRVVNTQTGSLVERSADYLQSQYYEYKLSGKLNWRPNPDDSVGVTIQATPSKDGRHTFSRVVGPAGSPLRLEDSQVTGDPSLAWEAGVDWDHRVSARSSFRLLALSSHRDSGSDERYRTAPAAGQARTTLIRRSSGRGEQIGRGIWTFRATPTHSLEFGLEGASNFLDSGLNVSLDAGSGPVPVRIPVANTRVEESRGEIYATDVWRPTRGFTLEAGVTAETSRIAQSGDASQQRVFTYVKPRVVATWNRKTVELRLKFERDIAQLDFNDFASAVSLFDGTVTLGNPNLEPERTWRTQLDWERRFGPKSVFTLSVFEEQVEAVQDKIPVAGVADAPGNLGHGQRIGAKLDLLAPLDALALPRGELRVRGMIQDSRVRDPVNMMTRRFSDEAGWSYTVELRQPIPRLKLAWGATWDRADIVPIFKLKEQWSTGWNQAHLTVYGETTAFGGVLVRLTAADLFLPKEVRQRRFFTPDRSATANLSSIETRRGIGGYGTRSITLRVSGRF